VAEQTYTYYTPDHPEGVVVADAALDGLGKAWILGAYRHPDYPSPANVRVGNAGIKVWMVMNWLKLADGNVDEVRHRYPGVLEPEDVKAAQWYYERHKDWIDHRLKEEAEVV
jgi:uncharacterized protein (DUF433 family)